MAKSRYNWELMKVMYEEGNYTTTDLHYIFGPVAGHISKRFREDFNINAKPRGKKVMQISPRAFNKTLNQKIREEGDPDYKALLKRIDLYYKNVCLPLKGAEVIKMKEQGLSNAKIAERYDNLSERSVGRLFEQFKGESEASLKAKVGRILNEFERTKPKKSVNKKGA